jgi:hypothetical protein
VVITLFAGISMKIIFRGFCTLFALSFSHIAMAGTPPPYGEDAPNPELKSMAFAQCVEIIRDYENDLGPAKVVIERRYCVLCGSRPTAKTNRSPATGMTAS